MSIFNCMQKVLTPWFTALYVELQSPASVLDCILNNGSIKVQHSYNGPGKANSELGNVTQSFIVLSRSISWIFIISFIVDLAWTSEMLAFFGPKGWIRQEKQGPMGARQSKRGKGKLTGFQNEINVFIVPLVLAHVILNIDLSGLFSLRSNSPASSCKFFQLYWETGHEKRRST